MYFLTHLLYDCLNVTHAGPDGVHQGLQVRRLRFLGWEVGLVESTVLERFHALIIACTSGVACLVWIIYCNQELANILKLIYKREVGSDVVCIFYGGCMLFDISAVIVKL